MKKTLSLITNLLLASTLFWGVPVAAEELIEKETAELTGYCHMKFPPMREVSLSWDRPVLKGDAEKSIDFYGPCDYDPTGPAEIQAQRALRQNILRGDGSND